VRVVETGRSYSTDTEGNFAIRLEPGNYTLEVSYISYESQQRAGIEVTAGKDVSIQFALKEGEDVLNEVVVTALGLTREEKSLGYAVTKLDNDDLTNTKSSNWLNSMQGKVAGLI